jgi:hypothetical protein
LLESETTSERDVQEKEALRELLEAEASVQIEFNKEQDYWLYFIDAYICSINRKRSRYKFITKIVFYQ